MPAIRLALSDETVDALYILSDGMPDDSTQFVLRETAALLQHREKVKVRAALFCDNLRYRCLSVLIV